MWRLESRCLRCRGRGPRRWRRNGVARGRAELGLAGWKGGAIGAWLDLSVSSGELVCERGYGPAGPRSIGAAAERAHAWAIGVGVGGGVGAGRREGGIREGLGVLADAE